MSVTRFGSQIKPIDSTESQGYVFYPAVGLYSNAAQTALNSGLPGALFTSTSAGTVSTFPDEIPHDLDSSQTCYLSLVYGSATTATDATVVYTVAYNSFTAGGTAVAQTTAGIAATTITCASTVGYVTASSTSAMGASPTPGNKISWLISADPLTANTFSVLGVRMQYTRRFV